MAAALTLVLLTFGLVFLVAAAQEALVERLRAGTATVRRWGGRLLLLVGIWMISLGVFADFFAGVFPV